MPLLFRTRIWSLGRGRRRRWQGGLTRSTIKVRQVSIRRRSLLPIALPICCFSALLPYLWTSIRAGTASLLDGPTAFPLPKLGGVLAILGANLPSTLSEAFVGHLAEIARRSVGGLMLDLDDEDSDKDWIRGRMGLVGELIERKGLGEVLRHDDMFTQVRSGVFSTCSRATADALSFANQVVDALLEGDPENVLTTLPDSASARLYRVYFSWRQDSESTKEAFSALCEVLASDKLDKPLKFGVIKSLLDELAVVGDVQLVEKGEPGKLDGVCSALLEELRVGTAAEEDVEVLQSLMNRPRTSSLSAVAVFWVIVA